MAQPWEHPPTALIPSALRPHVRAIVGFAAHGLEPGVHRGLPSDGITLVMSLDRPLVTAPSPQAWADGVRDSQWVSLGGLHTRPAMVEQPGQWAGVQLSLHPVGVRKLLGVPAADLPVGSWDARDLLGSEIDRVVEELHVASDWTGRYAAVTGLLMRRADRAARAAAPREAAPEVREAWRLLTTRPDLAVADVAHEVGYSRRRLAQLIAVEVGHAPKVVQRLARFDRARRLISDGRTPTSLSEVATRTGYYDQSHMVREFQQFAGLGPSAWLAAEFPNIQGTATGGSGGWST